MLLSKMEPPQERERTDQILHEETATVSNGYLHGRGCTSLALTPMQHVVSPFRVERYPREVISSSFLPHFTSCSH